MSEHITTSEFKAKIILDEANLAFYETTQRKDEPGSRELQSSGWEEGKMEGEFDEEDYERILALQLEAANICDTNPELEQKTEELFQKVDPDNAESILKEILEDPDIKNLGRIGVTMFLLRFPTVQSFVNKGHPLVLATDEYMLENADAQNWHDYTNLAREMGWDPRD
ncbi:MAG: hypothetical protein GWM98_08915 [Nitrospinaceae bacterium]|nr:hypothetical protein [Nitrospinaceae bacterium]NIR54583.1 hypothetical protein [Nitrospinaceae bacterium]NIS85005.1 hypothetical protein [Nitrospinaceae bacterium]NIT81816.1 hypothetical protein [Nitrospinaceae bacterium]NIU44079.1 hypothetical protein [Nitrospinaceae bacterium]